MTWKAAKFIFWFVVITAISAMLFFCDNSYAQDNDTTVSVNQDSVTVSRWLIVLDPAHGIETPGKRSPDGLFREYKFSRDILELLSSKFDSIGIHYAFSNETNREIGLRTRVNNTNKLVRRYRGKSLFISIHCNALGNGSDWMNGRGYSVWTTRGVTKADEFAEIIISEFEISFPKIKILGLYESNFRVLLCAPPAVLCETLFQDNLSDIEMLQNDEFRNEYCNVLTRSIHKYILSR